MGAIHSTQISRLRFENFLGTTGWRWVQSHSIPLLKRVLRSFKLSNVGLLLLHRYVPVEFKDFQTPLSNNEKKKKLKLSWEIRNGQMEQSTSIGSVQLSKVVHLERWTRFFKTFLFGPGQSIQF